MSDQDHDRSCMDRLRAGDTRALEELYDRYGAVLYGLALRIVGRATDAEEVVQETWVQAWRQATSYDSSRGAVAAWLITIARSRAIDRLRRRATRDRVEGALGPDTPRVETPDASAMRGQLREKVSAALATLAPQQREVVELAYFRGLSQSEIAERIGAPLGTVKSWTRQALLHLRDLVPRGDWA